MKGIRGTRVLCLAMAVALAALGLGGTALALSPEKPQDVACFIIDKCVVGNEYTLLVLAPGTSTEAIQNSDILFMDQLTANGNNIRAAVILPDFSECVAVAGGEFSDGTTRLRKLGDFKATRLPGALDAVGESAFENVDFTHIYLGGAVSAIGARAFANCASLEYIYIPKSVASIADDAFAGSKKVIIGCYKDSAAHKFAKAKGLSVQLVN